LTRFRAYAWLIAARPKTLPAAAAPVLMGAAMAYGDGAFHALAALCALTGALLIQIGTNYSNDYFDHKKGADTRERIGPLRVTQAGLIPPETMKLAAVFVFALALLPGAYIVWRGGWPFVAIGGLSILFGVLYTAGPCPLGYVGLADPAVLIFFGPVALCGTYYVQTLELTREAVLAGFAPGLLSAAILTVNNLRDIESDRKAGKRTLAVRFGRTFARVEYLFCIVAATIAIPAGLWALTGNMRLGLYCMLVIFVAQPIIRVVFTTTDGERLNRALAGTGVLLLVFSVLFSIAWIL